MPSCTKVALPADTYCVGKWATETQCVSPGTLEMSISVVICHFAILHFNQVLLVIVCVCLCMDI